MLQLNINKKAYMGSPIPPSLFDYIAMYSDTITMSYQLQLSSRAPWTFVLFFGGGGKFNKGVNGE